MPRLRGNEWNFANRAASLVSSILAEPEFLDSPLGHAESELSELRGARRLDLAIFRRDQERVPLVTGELKLPWNAEGRTPYNSRLVDDAHAKATRAGALYFLTWNVRRLVLWKTDDPGVELYSRVLLDREMTSVVLASEEDLVEPRLLEDLRVALRDVLQAVHSHLSGPPRPEFLPLDRLFVARLEASLDFPITATAQATRKRMQNDARFRREIERWMRERQGWVVSKATEPENIDRASRLACYILVNKLCFYNVLRRKYDALPRLSVANNTNTGILLERRLSRAFVEAQKFTGDYETVFEDDFGDRLPFLADEAVVDWRALVRSLDHYDFSTIPVDIVGSMYERLISPEERHRYGQHYTPTPVVDLINSFAIASPQARVLDPACGGGTFLVRGYIRKRLLDPAQDHSELLENIYGCDLMSYACHLATVNLAIRDLIDDDNFPRIHHGDFLALEPGAIFSYHPIRVQAHGLIIDKRPISIAPSYFDAVVGNPPYVSARELPDAAKRLYFETANRNWPGFAWRRSSDIYIYFFLQAARFLAAGGVMALLTQSAWLDTEYGFPLQHWMLLNFKIVAIIESDAEPWFTGARVATTITVLARQGDSDERGKNSVRFVQFKKKLSELVDSSRSEEERRQDFEELSRALLGSPRDFETLHYRVRAVQQQALLAAGTAVSGEYLGSRWGRYLRSINSLYCLQAEYTGSFVPLRLLASIRRGVTTNCDEFFIVTVVSEEALGTHQRAEPFRLRYGVSSAEVKSGKYAIVKRADGVEVAIEKRYLVPLLKSGRDLKSFATSALESSNYIVDLSQPRHELSRLARQYVEAGEREGWNRRPSFEQAGDQWYSLRLPKPAPVLFVKTMQYSPIVLFNDGRFVANQRLYQIEPLGELDSEAICALLNSTLVAAERYSAVKSLGREAAIDFEVFATEDLRLPDIRNFQGRYIDVLRSVMKRMSSRQASPFLEEVLQECGVEEARAYVNKVAVVTREVWPKELLNEDRQELDEALLLGIGIKRSNVKSLMETIYNELLTHTRRLRLLELDAQGNRRGIGGRGPSVAQLADEIWAELRSTSAIEPRRLPKDFIDESLDTAFVDIPIEKRYWPEEPSLFTSDFAVKFGSGKRLLLASVEQLSLVSFLLSRGIAGRIQIPSSSRDCARITKDMERYWKEFQSAAEALISHITSDSTLAQRVFREAARRLMS